MYNHFDKNMLVADLERFGLSYITSHMAEYAIDHNMYDGDTQLINLAVIALLDLRRLDYVGAKDIRNVRMALERVNVRLLPSTLEKNFDAILDTLDTVESVCRAANLVFVNPAHYDLGGDL